VRERSSSLLLALDCLASAEMDGTCVHLFTTSFPCRHAVAAMPYSDVSFDALKHTYASSVRVLSADRIFSVYFIPRLRARFPFVFLLQSPLSYPTERISRLQLDSLRAPG
jgi:hypothetical protein